MKPEIIPTKIVKQAEEIKELLSQEGNIGVVIVGGRRSGRTLLANLVMNTQDVEHEEIKPKQIGYENK